LGTVRSNLKQVADHHTQTTGCSISVRQLAKNIDYRFESVRRMYNDETKQFPRDLLTKLCDYFGCSISDLLIYEKDGTEEHS
jgi:DNA-binding Xre family transcriptional regulator